MWTTHPKSAGEVDFEDNLLVASRDAHKCQSNKERREKKETHIEKPRRTCSRCIEWEVKRVTNGSSFSCAVGKILADDV